MEFNQFPPYHHNGPTAGYPPQYMNPYYSLNHNFGNPLPAGIHVRPRMAPPMDYANANHQGQYTNIYGNGYSFPPDIPSTAQTSYQRVRPPHEVRPTLHRNPNEYNWHTLKEKENRHAALDHRNSPPVPRPSMKRKPRRSKSKPGTVEIKISTSSANRNMDKALQSHVPTLDVTMGGEDFVDSSPDHSPSVSMAPNTSQASHQRSNSNTAANVSRSRNRHAQPWTFEAPRYANANPQIYHRQRGEEEQMRAERWYMEPPGGMRADDHLIAQIEAMVDQHKRSRAGSTTRSRVSSSNTDTAMVFCALNMVNAHLEQRNRE